MDGVALEAADRLDDRLTVAPRQFAFAHVVALGGLEDGRVGADEHLRLTVIVGALDDRLVDTLCRFGDIAEVLADRPRHAVSPTDRVDDERRALHAVAAAEEPVDAGVTTAVGGDQATLRLRARLAKPLHA